MEIQTAVGWVNKSRLWGTKRSNNNKMEMQWTSAFALPCYCCSPFPCHFPFPYNSSLQRHHHHPKRKHARLASLSLVKTSTLISDLRPSFLTFIPISTCRTQQNHDPCHQDTESNPYPTQRHRFLHQYYFSIDGNSASGQNPRTPNQEEGGGEEPTGGRAKKKKGLFTKMWWADVKAALGQRLNLGAIVSSAVVVAKERHLALPHVIVPDIRHIDWSELHRRGFKGVVFDKDNTITAPYCLTLWGPLKTSIEQCKLVFGHDIAVFSNSAGLQEYDHDGSKAKALEGAIGIKVLRHRVKKPVGTAEEIEKHFGCKSSQLIMVGDRPLTDVVFGNRNGFLTILTEPLSLTGEPFIVRQVRKLEMTLVNLWFRKGLRPISHNLLPDATKCVKDPPPF